MRRLRGWLYRWRCWRLGRLEERLERLDAEISRCLEIAEAARLSGSRAGFARAVEVECLKITEEARLEARVQRLRRSLSADLCVSLGVAR